MAKHFSTIEDFMNHHHASTTRGRGGFRGRGRGRGSAAPQAAPATDAFSSPLDWEGLNGTPGSRGRGNRNGRGHQDNRGRGAYRGAAGGPSQPIRGVNRGGLPPNGRGSSKGPQLGRSLNIEKDDSLLEVGRSKVETAG